MPEATVIALKLFETLNRNEQNESRVRVLAAKIDTRISSQNLGKRPCGKIPEPPEKTYDDESSTEVQRFKLIRTTMTTGCQRLPQLVLTCQG